MFLIALTGVQVSLLIVSGWLVASTVARRSAEAQRRTWAVTFLAVAVLPVASPFVPALYVPLVPNFTATSVAFRPSHTRVADRGEPAVDFRGGSHAHSGAVAETRSLGAGELLAAVWVLGMLLGLARSLRRLVERRRLVATARPAHEAWQRTWRSLGTRVERGRRPRLLESAKVSVPQTWGVLRPVIVVPAGSAGWPAERRGVVLLHELLHLHRWDPALVLFAHTLCVLHWFNPLVWSAYRRFRVSIEKACDDASLSESYSPEGYAGHLVGLARTVSERQTVAAAIGFSAPRELEGRIRAILDPRNRRTCSRARTAFVVCSLVFTTLLVGAARPIPRPTILLDGPSGFRWIEADRSQNLYIVDVALEGRVMLSGDSSRVLGVGPSGGRLRITELRPDRTPVYEAVLTGLPRGGVAWIEHDPDGGTRAASRRTMDQIREHLPAVVRTWAWSVAGRREQGGASDRPSGEIARGREIDGQAERFLATFASVVGGPLERLLDELGVDDGRNATNPSWLRPVAEGLWTRLSISIRADQITVASEDGPFSDALVSLFRSHLERTGITLSGNNLSIFEEAVRAAGAELQQAWESELNAIQGSDER